MELTWNEKGLLCGRTFKWTYATFEKYLNECITPSMYNAMASFVFAEMSNDELNAVDRGDYIPGALEIQAVDAYFDLPICKRIDMHEQELVNLRAAKRLADEKESAAIDAMLEENRPFDHSSPIDQEYNDFMRSLIDKYRRQSQHIEGDIFEEENWYGGHEYGSENAINQYDHADEL